MYKFNTALHVCRKCTPRTSFKDWDGNNHNFHTGPRWVRPELPHSTEKGAPRTSTYIYMSGKGTPKMSTYCSTCRVPELPYSTWILGHYYRTSYSCSTVADYSHKTCSCLDDFNSSTGHGTLYPPGVINGTNTGVLLSTFVTCAMYMYVEGLIQIIWKSTISASALATAMYERESTSASLPVVPSLRMTH